MRRSARRALAGFGVMALAAVGLVSSPSSAVAGGDGMSSAGWACVGVAKAYGDFGDALTLQNATFTGGTLGDDRSDNNGGGPVQPGETIPVWCGFSGNDVVPINYGWVYGGTGNDNVYENWLVFKGGPGQDYTANESGYFAGGPGDDHAVNGGGGRFDGGPGNDYIEQLNQGVFNGGPGNDSIPYEVNTVHGVNLGTFNGGSGRDWVGTNNGLFNGGRDADFVQVNFGTFDGGPGWDVVKQNYGTCINVERGC